MCPRGISSVQTRQNAASKGEHQVEAAAVAVHIQHLARRVQSRQAAILQCRRVKIRDTATSHERLFFIEVMGRDAGFLALNGAIASGAEAAIIPEISTEVDQLAELIQNGFRKSKNSSIVLVAESPVTGGAMGLAQRVKNEYPGYDVRVSILGHLQRGGSPTAHDRILASRMGAAAIDALLDDQRNVMIGIKNDTIVYVPFTKAIKNDKPINRTLLDTLRRLSI